MDPPLKKLKMDPFMKKLQMEISKAGESPLELLPPCILEKILGYVTEFKNIHRLLAVSITISETAEEVCFGAIRKIKLEFVRRDRIVDVIYINGECNSSGDFDKILRYFSSKTKKIIAISVYDRTTLLQRHQEFLSNFWEILLENSEKNNWKLKVLEFSASQLPLEYIRRFLKFNTDTLEELRLCTRPNNSCEKFPLEDLGRCLKLRKLDIGEYNFDLDTLNPLLQSSQLRLTEFRSKLSSNAAIELVAILKRFGPTLEKIYCNPPFTLSLGQLLNKFEENDGPFRDLRHFYCTWLTDIYGDENIDVKKLFRLFPNLQTLSKTVFIGNCLYQFARDFLDLFHHDTVEYKFALVTTLYYGPRVDLYCNLLVEAFPPSLYKWVSIITSEDVYEIVIQRGNAQITLHCEYRELTLL